jgi:uncharacterized protein (TIGR03067 family)
MRAVFLSLVAICALNAADPPLPDQQAIAGSWRVVACELEEKLLPEKVFKDLDYQLKEDGTWALKGGPGFPKATGGTFTLGPKASPKTIDFTPADGPFKGKTFRGIYQLEGDELKACFAFPDKERPKIFVTGPGSVLEFWRRAKR